MVTVWRRSCTRSSVDARMPPVGDGAIAMGDHATLNGPSLLPLQNEMSAIHRVRTARRSSAAWTLVRP
jgi:hypothetical protein